MVERMISRTELTKEEIRTIILDILTDIDQVCREHGLTYFLAGGTLLGAVREKGFIPWDDDADVMMPREDYMQFIQIMNTRINPPFVVGSLYTNSDWSFPFARMYDVHTVIEYDYLNESPMGVCVDIFPLDGLPENLEENKKHFKKIRNLWSFRFMSVRKKWKLNENMLIVKKAVRAVAKLIGPNYFSRKMDRLAQTRQFNNSEYVGCGVMCVYMEKEHFKRDAFLETVQLPFEQLSLSAPKGYDHYLTSLYGDYMTPPEASQRVATHDYHVYWVHEKE